VTSIVQNCEVNSPQSSDCPARRSLVAGSESRTAELGDKSLSGSTSHDNVQNVTDARAGEASPSSNTLRKLSPAKRTRQSSSQYVYTAIKDIKTGSSVNVFGVVKFVRPASRGRGTGE